MTVVDGPLVCRCGAEWVGPLILPLRSGESRRLRTCDTCCEKAEAIVMARFLAMGNQPERIELADIDNVRMPYPMNTSDL